MTMLRHTAGLRQIYNKMRFTKIVQKSYDKHATKLRQTVRQLISCHMTASRTRGVIISIFHSHIILA